MPRGLVPPRFAVPPETYNSTYFDDMVRLLSTYIFQMQQPGEMRATVGTFTALSTNDVGLEQGALFEVDGFVKISRLSNPHVAGSSGASAVGSVTVLTP
tara:strand:- start:674 stop:970 length:297 start_codon:yes stop_codon:yes gene_type:complete